MNLHRCRSCGLKLETGDICQRCQDIDKLAQDVFSSASSNPKKNYSNLISVQECQEEWSARVNDLRERLLQMISREGMRIFSGIETDPVELDWRRATSFHSKSFAVSTPPRHGEVSRICRQSVRRNENEYEKFFDSTLGEAWKSED